MVRYKISFTILISQAVVYQENISKADQNYVSGFTYIPLESIQKEKGALSKENALFRQQEITSCDASAASSSLRAFSMNAPHCSASSGSNLTCNPGTESKAHFSSTDSMSVAASSGHVSNQPGVQDAP